MSRKKINWLDHLVSLFVVILGITIAFFLENNRDRIRLEKQESEYIDGLLDDLRNNAVAIDTLVQYNGSILKVISELSNAAIGSSELNESTLADYMIRIQFPPVFLPQRTAYESLKGSGQMTLISDLELRKKVIGVYEYYYAAAAEYDQSISDQIRDLITPYYMDNIAYTSSSTIDSAFLKDAYFSKIIFFYRGIYEGRSAFYEEIQVQTHSLIAELEAFQD